MAQFSSKYLQEKCFCFLKKSDIERFHSRDQHLCKCIGTIGSIYIRKRFISHRTPTWTSFHCFGTQYGRHDVMRICSIPRCSCPQKRETRVKVSPGSPRIPGTRLRSFANAKVHLVSLAAFFFGCHATLRCVTSKKTVARESKVHRMLQIPT